MEPFYHIAAGKHWCDRHAAGPCCFLAHRPGQPIARFIWNPKGRDFMSVELFELDKELIS